MKTQKLKQALLFGLFAVFMVARFVSAEKTVSVIGSIECSDCSQKRIKLEDALKGLRVAIKCKSTMTQYETKGVSQLDKLGNFRINLAELKPGCLAEIRDESNKPCPKPSPLTLKFSEEKQNVFTIESGSKMQFNSSICSSKSFLPFYYCDPFHKYFLSKKPCTPVPTVPEYKPPTPEYKPPTPVYNNPTPSYNPTPSTGYNPTPTPVYKPTPTPTPVGYGPKYTFPPIYKHPFFKKKPFFPPAKDEKKN
ncbi:hypothetical protein LUZ60_015152 [Juncus effusus]|nr:hypothetical protein LUZ60_015152 [Juncus effusus]